MNLNTTQMSSFLMYRMINPESINTVNQYFPQRVGISNSYELETYLADRFDKLDKESTAIALSGGIDSAILAKFMPKGSTAYTFKCVVPGKKVTDETPIASTYAKECGLKHKTVEIYWSDFEEYSDTLMRHKKAPIHSIEVQIYKAALQAKKDGFKTLVFGEAADAVYGGLSNLLSKDWKVGDFIQRYSFLLPYYVLKNSDLPLNPIKKYVKNGYVDPHDFISNVFIQESIASYINATEAAGIEICLPYPETILADKIDYQRIRSGENKYLIRELFTRLYPDFPIQPKTPMPRPMQEWLNDWQGPTREEFWPNCVEGLSGDEKWLLWILERYLNLE